MSENTFVIVYEGDHLMADLLKSFLEEGGLHVYMENSNMYTIAPFQLTAGGMNPALLKVVSKDVDRAYELIKEFNTEEE